MTTPAKNRPRRLASSPSHFTVTVTGFSHSGQANSSFTVSSVMGNGPRGSRGRPRARGGPGCASPGLLALALGAVLRTGLLAVLHPLGVEHPPDDVVPHPRQVADAAAADQHDRVLLEVVALARDVGRHLDA